MSTVLEQFAQCDVVDVCFVLCCCAFCFPIVPAVGLGYAGYSTSKNALSSFYTSLLAAIVVTIQCYSLAYSDGNGIIGDLSKAFHRGVLAAPIGTIPELLFSFFQLLFCMTVCAIVLGGGVERVRLRPMMVFAFMWATFVYCPLAHMIWADTGVLKQLGVMDFAGGTPVHICSGASATAISVYLSRPIGRSRRSSKRTPSHLALHRPHNSLCQLISMVTIWAGWLAFDAGTTLSLNFKSVIALFSTNCAAACGLITWIVLDHINTGQWSLDSAFMGMISGLVFITPSAGFLGVTSACSMGVIGSLICRTALKIKFTERARLLKWVDAGDTFATHCVGGFCATILTGVLGSKEVAGYDGSEAILGGLLFDGHWRQVPIQILEALIGLFWAFGASFTIMTLIDCVPGLEVLCEDSEIRLGMDKAQMDESIYEAQWADEVEYEPLQGHFGI